MPSKAGLGFYLREAYRAFSRQFQTRLARHGVTHGQWVVLWLLSQHGTLTPMALSREAGIKKASATAVIEELERRRLIVRDPDPRDRRKVNLMLTRTGAGLVTELIACAVATNAMVDTQLSAPEVETLVRLLGIVTGSFGDAESR